VLARPPAAVHTRKRRARRVADVACVALGERQPFFVFSIRPGQDPHQALLVTHDECSAFLVKNLQIAKANLFFSFFFFENGRSVLFDVENLTESTSIQASCHYHNRLIFTIKEN
jgi:hypothetical protein